MARISPTSYPSMTGICTSIKSDRIARRCTWTASAPLTNVDIDTGFLEHFEHDHLVDIVVLGQQDASTASNPALTPTATPPLYSLLKAKTISIIIGTPRVRHGFKQAHVGNTAIALAILRHQVHETRIAPGAAGCAGGR